MSFETYYNHEFIVINCNFIFVQRVAFIVQNFQVATCNKSAKIYKLIY